ILVKSKAVQARQSTRLGAWALPQQSARRAPQEGSGPMTAITVTLSQTALISRIKAHIAKGDKAKDKAEQHYIAAGQYLKQLKDDCPDQKTFLEKVEKEIGIGKSRTYELMQIGDGRKTVEEVRADTAKRTANAKAGLKLSASSGQKAEPEAGDKAIKTEPDGKGEDKGFLVDA